MYEIAEPQQLDKTDCVDQLLLVQSKGRTVLGSVSQGWHHGCGLSMLRMLGGNCDPFQKRVRELGAARAGFGERISSTSLNSLDETLIAAAYKQILEAICLIKIFQ